MKVTVTKKSSVLPLVISTEFIKLDAALKFAAVVESGGGGEGGGAGRGRCGQRGDLHHAGQEAPPRGPVLLRRENL